MESKNKNEKIKKILREGKSCYNCDYGSFSDSSFESVKAREEGHCILSTPTVSVEKDYVCRSWEPLMVNEKIKNEFYKIKKEIRSYFK